MQRRLSISFVAVCVLFALLTIRLMFIEKTSGERYEKKVLSQQEYDSSIIPYQRGDITDRRGTVLATSVDVYNVILDSKVLNAVKNTNEKNKKKAAAAAAAKAETEAKKNAKAEAAPANA